MARHWFGGTPADFAVQITSTGLLKAASSPVTFWTAPTGGSQLTDLLDGAGSPLSNVSTSGSGDLPQRFQGPDGADQMWVDAGAGRKLLLATDAGLRISALEAATGAGGVIDCGGAA